MAELYKTSDGKIHDNIGSALAHQDIVNTENANRESQFSSSFVDHRVYHWDVIDHKYSNGDVYTGWLERFNDQGYPSGKGKMVSANGQTYEGEWAYIKSKRGSFPHGKGTYTFPSGEIIEGDYNEGDLVKGKKTYANGNVYEGDFVDWSPHGKGKMTLKNGNVYEGDYVYFKDKNTSQMHGKGKMTWANPKVCKEFEGNYVNGKKNGKGKYLLTDGRIFEGDFDGNGSATGKMTYPNGKTEQGTWDDNNDVLNL